MPAVSIGDSLYKLSKPVFLIFSCVYVCVVGGAASVCVCVVGGGGGGR